MYLESGKKHECTGCSACTKICPVGAIKMQADEEGFLYPVIQKEKCIGCNLCKKKCAAIPQRENKIEKGYGLKHKNDTERITSRSGGAFVALSDIILKDNGVVYGADIKEDFTVFHNRVENEQQRARLKGSKYVQSEMGNTIIRIANDLKEGKKVMFSGTPCQVEGVRKALEKENTENLFTCDLLCHGVPTQKILKDYLKFIETKENKRIVHMNFRDKKYGWSEHHETFTFEDGSCLSAQHFRNLFYGHNILRPSCYECKYANTKRSSDINIGDFWGVETIAPSFYDEKGVSVIFINTKKGAQWFEHIKDEVEFIEIDTNSYARNTYALNDNHSPMPETREKFWQDYKENNFSQIIEKYAK